MFFQNKAQQTKPQDNICSSSYREGYNAGSKSGYQSAQRFFLNQLLQATTEKQQMQQLVNDLIEQNNKLLEEKEGQAQCQ